MEQDKMTRQPRLDCNSVTKDVVREWIKIEHCTATSLLDLASDDPQAFSKVYKHHTGFNMSKTGETRFVGALRQLAKTELPLK